MSEAEKKILFLFDFVPLNLFVWTACFVSCGTATKINAPTFCLGGPLVMISQRLAEWPIPSMDFLALVSLMRPAVGKLATKTNTFRRMPLTPAAYARRYALRWKAYERNCHLDVHITPKRAHSSRPGRCEFGHARSPEHLLAMCLYAI